MSNAHRINGCNSETIIENDMFVIMLKLTSVRLY